MFSTNDGDPLGQVLEMGSVSYVPSTVSTISVWSRGWRRRSKTGGSSYFQRMLKAKVVMSDGVVVSRDEGVPQGGPHVAAVQ
jgi:hypothetical protein